MEPRLPRLLVVDDESIVHETLPSALAERVPAECVAARTVEEAREVLRDQHIDLVLVDFALPGADGVRFLSEVRRDYPQVARIMITGYGTPEVARRARDEAGVQAFVTKPYNLRWMARAVREVVEGRKPPRQRRPGRGWSPASL